MGGSPDRAHPGDSGKSGMCAVPAARDRPSTQGAMAMMSMIRVGQNRMYTPYMAVCIGLARTMCIRCSRQE